MKKALPLLAFVFILAASCGERTSAAKSSPVAPSALTVPVSETAYSG